MESTQLVDCAGRRRSPATVPGYHRGRPPRNRGLRYPADPPTVEEIISVMRAAGDSPDGVRLRGVIVVLWARRAADQRSARTERERSRPRTRRRAGEHGKGDKRREVGMDRWAWEQLHPWLELRATLPVGSSFCVLRGPTRGRPCSAAGIRVQLHIAAHAAGVRRLLHVLGGSRGDGTGVELANDEVDHRDEVAVGAVPAGAAFRGLDQRVEALEQPV